jgi:hypothetical protein
MVNGVSDFMTVGDDGCGPVGAAVYGVCAGYVLGWAHAPCSTMLYRKKIKKH